MKSLVELHGGHVSAESGGRGHGAAFTVTLPLLEAGSAGAAVAPEQAPACYATRGSKVLVVDDNEDAAETLRMLLASMGHEVQVVHHSAQAVEAAQAASFDAFVLDIGLPGMDGHALARALRAGSGSSAATLIALTGYGSAADKRRAENSGFDHYLVKPADPGELQRLLQRDQDP